MSPRILSVALLLLCISLSTQVRARFPIKPVPLCCNTVSPDDVSSLITGNPEIQHAHGKCVHALIFKSKQDREKLCVDPKAAWVQKYMK
ncbi:C-C motif chemokine 3-like [Solea senegalensis]|nr:C-C motif chemokine 3-like [Solea senegalensis]